MVRKWDILKGDNTGARAGKSEAGKQGWPMAQRIWLSDISSKTG